jgi:hypothetical protein
MSGQHTMFECLCDCGNTVYVRGSGLLSSHVQSCGCQKIDSARIKKVPRGMSSLKSCYGFYERCAKNRNLDFQISLEVFQKITSENCYYCGAKPSNSHQRTRGNGAYIYNGIDRIDNNKGYIDGNIVPCCKRCNYMKSAMGFDDFLNHIKRINNHLKLENISQSDMRSNIRVVL